ncbi:MAG: hypothetical protein A3F68_05700 [Acidobacteria bacterium RIFCSPLOWO2_12_FULL_54_10]|nr:MAG: hypothetical protein A3F68_05700 [Acidobacteria bacterium RIFCSPLOWO2_12_FULL_54_10]
MTLASRRAGENYRRNLFQSEHDYGLESRFTTSMVKRDDHIGQATQREAILAINSDPTDLLYQSL